MTLNKDKQIILPVWLISVLISLLITGASTWGIISSKSATLEIRASHNEQNIKELQEKKVSREEMNLILEQLNRIEGKLDKHVLESK
jgi:lipopolysaccharide export LptBFGC system permease protein LptF